MSWFVRVSKNSLFLLIVGTILTASVGTWINDQYQEETWEREKRFEIAVRRLADFDRLLEDVPKMINRRFFSLRRVLWAASSGDQAEFRSIWVEYYGYVIEWNEELNSHHSRIQRLAGSEMAERFLSHEPMDADAPWSLHAMFRQAHYQVDKVRRSLLRNEGNLSVELDKARTLIDAMDPVTDRYVEDLTDLCLTAQAELWKL